MIIKIYKDLGGTIVEDSISETCWNLLTIRADGSKNGWYEVEKKEAPKPPKEVLININKRKVDEVKEDNIDIDQYELDKIDGMKRQELFAYCKENNIKFSPKDRNDIIKQNIKDAISKK